MSSAEKARTRDSGGRRNSGTPVSLYGMRSSITRDATALRGSRKSARAN